MWLWNEKKRRFFQASTIWIHNEIGSKSVSLVFLIPYRHISHYVQCLAFNIHALMPQFSKIWFISNFEIVFIKSFSTQFKPLTFLVLFVHSMSNSNYRINCKTRRSAHVVHEHCTCTVFSHMDHARTHNFRTKIHFSIANESKKNCIVLFVHRNQALIKSLNRI